MEPDAETFTRLYHRSYRTIERYILQRVNDRELAQDLTSEAFARGFEKHLGGTTITIHWLLRTARNLIGNEYQRRAVRQAWMQQRLVEELAEVATWPGEMEDIEVRNAMRMLPAADALAIHLTYWEGLSTAEVASYLGCSVGAMWTRMSRARALLRALLIGEGAQATAMRPDEAGAVYE